jgi:hypothetical protein
LRAQPRILAVLSGEFLDLLEGAAASPLIVYGALTGGDGPRAVVASPANHGSDEGGEIVGNGFGSGFFLPG